MIQRPDEIKVLDFYHQMQEEYHDIFPGDDEYYLERKWYFKAKIKSIIDGMYLGNPFYIEVPNKCDICGKGETLHPYYIDGDSTNRLASNIIYICDECKNILSNTREVSLTKEFTFDACHFLPYHDRRCKYLHGHSYKLLITVKNGIDTRRGFVDDYTDIKNIVKEELLDPYLDHGFLNLFVPYPTSEYLVYWIWCILGKRLKGIEKIEIFETSTSSAILTKEDILKVNKECNWVYSEDDKKIPVNCIKEGEKVVSLDSPNYPYNGDISIVKKVKPSFYSYRINFINLRHEKKFIEISKNTRINTNKGYLTVDEIVKKGVDYIYNFKEDLDDYIVSIEDINKPGYNLIIEGSPYYVCNDLVIKVEDVEE